jgi:hypothetical protein
MEVVLAALFGGLVVAGVAVYLRDRKAKAATGATGPGALPTGSAAPTPDGDARALKVADVVAYENRDWIVEGTIRLSQDGFQWQEHRLVDGADTLWLSVEDDEGLEVVVWHRSPPGALEPGAASITHGGTTYTLEERGSAAYTAEGSTGTATSGQMDFADYANGDERLSFERWGGDGGWEVSTGRVISEHALDIYPSRGT